MKVSLIIPVKNEKSSIGRLLDSISCQTILPDEVIIVDGGSTDGTIELIREYKHRYHITLKCVPRANPGEGRNIGTSISKNAFIAYTDAGIILHPNWLENLIDIMRRDQTIDIVYGHYEPKIDSFFKECAGLAYISPIENIENMKMRHHFIASSLIKKKVWKEVGGFPSYRAAEDLIFMERIDKKGFKVGYAQNAIVYWEIPNNLIELFKKYVHYSMYNIIAGRWKYWHSKVCNIYFIGLLFFLLGIFHNWFWLGLIFLGLIGRAIKRFYINNRLAEIMELRRMIEVTIILIFLDIATLAGIGLFFKNMVISNENS